MVATLATVATLEPQTLNCQEVATVATVLDGCDTCDTSNPSVAKPTTVATVGCDSCKPLQDIDLIQRLVQVSQVSQLPGSTGQELAYAIEDAGFRMSVKDGKLFVSPAEKLTAEVRQVIRDNKSALMDYMELVEQDRWIVYLSDTGALDRKP